VVALCSSMYLQAALALLASTGWHRETEKFEVDVGSPVDVQ
jgi:hypothetical protein